MLAEHVSQVNIVLLVVAQHATTRLEHSVVLFDVQLAVVVSFEAQQFALERLKTAPMMCRPVVFAVWKHHRSMLATKSLSSLARLRIEVLQFPNLCQSA